MNSKKTALCAQRLGTNKNNTFKYSLIASAIIGLSSASVFAAEAEKDKTNDIGSVKNKQ